MPQTAVKREYLSLAGDRPWAILESSLRALFSAEGLSVEAATPTRPANRNGAVAVLPLSGIIEQHSSWVSVFFGGTSTEGFAAAFRAAMSDEQVKAVLIDVDSPGGSVYGVEELAAEIFKARGGKPIVAIANSMAASAAYWIATAADELVVTPSGQVGSIGIVGVHTDASRMHDMMGLTVSVITQGKFKAEGNPFEPLSDEARAYIEGQMGDYYSMFVNAVARGRGVVASMVRDGFGLGRMVNAAEAVKMGMADKVATFGQTLARLGGSAPAVRMPTAQATPEIAARLERMWDIETKYRAEGRRNAAMDQERIQKIHDLACENGAECSPEDMPQVSE